MTEVRAGLERARRIRKRADFTRIQDGGERISTRHFLLLFERRAAEAAPTASRLGVVASRKVGNAVARNRAKRLIREVFRQHAHLVPADVDLVVIARAGAHELALADATAELATAFPKMARRIRPPRGG